jgi:hypothetical protein
MIVLFLTCCLAIGSVVANNDNTNCKLRIPEFPLTSQGLMTPYELMPPCTMANQDTQAFVEAVLYNTATNQIRAYTPLITDANKAPATAPTPITVAPTEIVGLWFGFNGDALTLIERSNALVDGKCVNGIDIGRGKQSVFGQFAYCNADAFLTAVGDCAVCNIKSNMRDVVGDPCPTAWDFFIVDADPSDNLPMSYLLTHTNQTAQNTRENRLRLQINAIAKNPSDEGLLANFINPAIGCDANTVKITDATDAGTSRATLITNEIQARLRQLDPIAFLPDLNPMVLVNNKKSIQKLELYRRGIGQPLDAPSNTTDWCITYAAVAPFRFFRLKGFLTNAPSPDSLVATNLFTFLCMRFQNSLAVLKCKNKSPIRLVGDDLITDCVLR